MPWRPASQEPSQSQPAPVVQRAVPLPSTSAMERLRAERPIAEMPLVTNTATRGIASFGTAGALTAIIIGTFGHFGWAIDGDTSVAITTVLGTIIHLIQHYLLKDEVVL